jgi:hypothetical protein
VLLVFLPNVYTFDVRRIYSIEVYADFYPGCSLVTQSAKIFGYALLKLFWETDMSDNPETSTPPQDTAEELAEVIAELEQYRERLVNDTMTMAQRAKVLKAKVMANLEPDLQKIDTTLAELRDRQAALTAKN